MESHAASGVAAFPAIRALPTRYAGCHFRSRTEARWAVFFNSLPIRWEYEVEGFHFNGKAYLPDFYLPDLDLWAEVKPIGGFTDEVCDLLNSFARESKKCIALLEGAPRADGLWTIELDEFGVPRRVDAAFHDKYLPDIGVNGDEARLFVCTGCEGRFPSQFVFDEWDGSAVWQAIEAARSERFGT